MGFYEYFINNIIRPKHEKIEHLHNSSFRNYLRKKYGDTVEMIKYLSKGLIPLIQKPQQLIHDDTDYYTAIDMYTGTYYACFRNLLMLDIDYKTEQFETQSQILNFLDKFAKERDLIMMVYSSAHGVHAFLVDNERDFKDESSLQLMLDAGVDFYYIVYSYLRGWSVRLNKKERDDTEQIYTYIKCIGDIKSANSRLIKLTEAHYIESLTYDNQLKSKMY